MSSPCYLTVPVAGNFELVNVKAALARAGLLFIAVSSLVASDLTPKTLKLFAAVTAV